MLTGGVTVGPYRVLHKIGEGGMGTVYLGEHTLLGRRAAIKVLLPAFSASADIVKRFFNEARAATRIADPGIIAIPAATTDAGALDAQRERPYSRALEAGRSRRTVRFPMPTPIDSEEGRYEVRTLPAPARSTCSSAAARLLCTHRWPACSPDSETE